MTAGIAGTCGVRVKAQSVQGRFVAGIVASAAGGFTKLKGMVRADSPHEFAIST